MSITISQHPLMVACLSFSVLLSLTVTKHLISPGKGVKGRKDVGKDNDKEEVYVTNETYCLGAVVVTGNFWFLSPGLFGLFEKKKLSPHVWSLYVLRVPACFVFFCGCADVYP